MTAFRDSLPFLKGREAEERVAALLQKQGIYIIPSYDYSGPNGEKAPKLQGATNGIVLPDLGMARRGITKWAEVKYKWRPDFSRCTRTLDHGIGYRKWQHYRWCQQETGCQVWIYVVEGCSQRLLFQNIDELLRQFRGGNGHVYDGDAMDPGGMIFWPRQCFCPVTLSAIPGLFDDTVPFSF